MDVVARELPARKTQLKPVFEAFWGNEEARTCKNCGNVLQPPPPVASEAE